MSRALLCYDFLSRQIEIDASINLADPAEVAAAVKKNAACASCHQTLDPLAAYFGSFSPIYVPAQQLRYPVKHWLPALSPLFTATEPGYFGHKGEGLAHLGAMIAQDPRFSLCAARRFAGYFEQLRPEDVPLARAAELQKILVANNHDARALVKAIVKSDTALEENGLHKVRPSQLARMIEDLTGFRWETWLQLSLGGVVGRVDLMRDPLFGFKVLGGGVDAVSVTLPSHTMNASATLVLRSLAARAAPWVVANDFATADRAQRKLLGRVELADTAEPQVRAQLVDLIGRIHGELVEPNDDAVTAAWTLFDSARAEAGGDARRAWTTTIFAMLQDARIAFH